MHGNIEGGRIIHPSSLLVGILTYFENEPLPYLRAARHISHILRLLTLKRESRSFSALPRVRARVQRSVHRVVHSVLVSAMPSQYAAKPKLPKGFPDVLKGLVREMLRAQPEDINAFGAQYFADLQAKAAEPQGPARLSNEELKELLKNLFIQADADGSGALSLQEFKTVLVNVDLGLSDKEMKRIMAEADFDGNGEISYDEFIPLAVELVQSMYAKMDAAASRQAEEDQARIDAQNYLLHGMTKEEVESVMMEIFQKSDADGSGALSLPEFQKCCRDADIGLTKKEVQFLMVSCDQDGDGSISYEEFVPLCFEMLTEILKDEMLQERRTPSQLETFLIEVWSSGDAEGLGCIDALALKDLLKKADLGLTRLQIHSVLAEAEYDEQGMADYRKFAPHAAELVYRLLDMDTQVQKAEMVKGLLAGGQSFETVHGKNQGELAAHLNAEFAALDPAGSGLLSLPDLRKVLAASQLELTQNEISGLMSAAEANENGMCSYEALSSYAFYILQYMAQEAALH